MEAIKRPQQNLNIRATSSFGVVWLIGWLFTISFAKLVWWKAILALLLWPYFLGLVFR